MEKDAVVAQIVKVLSPYLGPTMAEASARAHCQKLGIVGKEMTDEQLDALIVKFGTGLSVFVGREKSGTVVNEIRRALQPGNQVA